jgi:hypothetical protein
LREQSQDNRSTLGRRSPEGIRFFLGGTCSEETQQCGVASKFKLGRIRYKSCMKTVTLVYLSYM